MTTFQNRRSAAVLLSAAVLAVAIGGASAQQVAPMDKMQDKTSEKLPADHQKMMQKTMQMQGHGGMGNMAAPTLPGQDAFGAIQEIVGIPGGRSQDRLVQGRPRGAAPASDRYERSDARRPTPGPNPSTAAWRSPSPAGPHPAGHPAHGAGVGRDDERLQGLDDQGGAATRRRDAHRDGELIPPEVAHIRGLGFIGLMVSGAHHQPHHLAMAKGEFDPPGTTIISPPKPQSLVGYPSVAQSPIVTLQRCPT